MKGKLPTTYILAVDRNDILHIFISIWQGITLEIPQCDKYIIGQ